MEYEVLKWFHLSSATLLFGTGFGSAFYKWRADCSGDLATIAHTNRNVVIADWIFTTPTIIIQPISGVWLAHTMGFELTAPWLLITYALFLLAGICWLPVVWLQIHMRDLAKNAMTNNTALCPRYHRYARYWFWLGIPAFSAMIVIYFLMIAKPTLVL